MKNNLKIFLIALILGMVASYIFCYKFDNTILSKALESKVTYFYVGSYNSEEAAVTKKNNYQNSIIYNDNGIYKIVIGVYKNKESIELMRSFFNDQGINFYQGELKISSEFTKNLESYETLIKTSSKDTYSNLNNYILKLFNEYIK